MESYTINRIQQEMTDSGSHWWDRDTMRSFGCRVNGQVYQGPGGIYFVTSEKYGRDDAKRAYTVRQYHPASKKVDTIGEFNTLSRSTAMRIAGKLAATSLDDQFTTAMAALDNAITGKCRTKESHQTCYGSVEKARECVSGSMFYFSDGGYTRALPHLYDDGSGYYLTIIPTFADEAENDRIRKAWGDAYKLQSEVCRILATEPAGETATVVTVVHHQTSATEQLVIDINRNGGHCTEPMAAYMIRLATAHLKAMEDYCNGTFEAYDEDGEPTKHLANLRKRIEKLAVECGCTGVHFQGDPRGATVKLNFKNGATNDWGKEGWCVPTRD
jgi:hypothetical protein